jgi:hypothetical protein
MKFTRKSDFRLFKILKDLQQPTATYIVIGPDGERDTITYFSSDEGYSYYVGTREQVYYRETYV